MRYVPATLALAVGIAAVPVRASAECRVIEFQFTPGIPSGLDPRFFSPQIVVWLEDAQGNFVDTIFITRMTGTYGLGNRPGRYDFNSELLWPYGRRQQVFPVWAHRHGKSYPLLVFQDLDDDDLSHALSQSSLESRYCRPLMTQEDTRQTTFDTGTCATATYTDKGKFSDTATSLYPPRNDLVGGNMADHDDVAKFAEVNDLDAISRATPTPGETYTILFAIPDELPDGDYVAWLEISSEYDFNATYNPDSYPPPAGIPWSTYGTPYRGQPSVVYRVPFVLATQDMSFQTTEYAGYGDPEGLDGMLNPPDPTITVNMEGSGAGRLLITTSPTGPYRFRVAVHPSDDTVAPGSPSALEALDVQPRAATLRFFAPGDDGPTGTAIAYEVRYRLGAELTAENFESAGIPAAENLKPMPAGTPQTFTLTDLLPETHYWIGIRAKDDCLNAGPPTFVHLVTPRQASGEVDGCFVATAAFGSPLQAEVGALRRFRDRVLRSTVLGELFVEAYYTFGPAFAAVIAPSDTLKGLARGALSPVVELATSIVE